MIRIKRRKVRCVVKKYPHLFSPLQVGSLTLRNRTALAPMSFTKQDFHRGFTQENFDMVERMAKGGVGLIILGETCVGKGSKSHVDMVLLDEPGIDRSLYRIAEVCHRHGAAISIEISHGGAYAHREFNDDQTPMTASPYSNAPGFSRGDGTKVRAMDANDMEHVCNQFAAAVKRVKDNGFDMAQIHFGHGWLVHEFLSPLYNNRTDEFGGCIENRMRFPMMILQRIRDVVGWDFPLDIRISGTEVLDGFLEGGLDTPDVIEVCKAASKYVNMISVSCGGIHNHYTVQRMSPGVYMERGINVYLATAVRNGLREAGINIPVSTVGALAEPEMMDEIIASGKADLCNMARQLIADPELPNKAREGREDEIYHCLRCSVCLHQSARAPERIFRCTINPTVGLGNSNSSEIAPAEVSKKVVIIGGGPAGMEAAITASKRGHKVIILEKKDHLGGMLDFADYVPFKRDIKIYRDKRIALVNKDPNIEVRLNTEATPELVASLNADAVIAAVGAAHKEAAIPGMEKAKIIYADELHDHEDELGEKIAVIGGGLTGSETAIYLAQQGRRVALIGRRDQFAFDASMPHMGSTNFMIGRVCAEAHKNTAVVEITETGVKCREKTTGEEFFVEADTVIIAVGMRGLTEEALAFDDAAKFTYIGDCRKAGTIMNATIQGYYAALDV